ncbi:PepSY-like domain-containing protein [Brachyspira alvinipulli]|uniref:PepSY-like domain-containing protein n=1 Tax=Brachyspira alvinipulli TaxID=84379 RepID=UPI0004AF21EB|nr:PepSY-like domain-containing protein [Brachyspira alvinipulli]
MKNILLFCTIMILSLFQLVFAEKKIIDIDKLPKDVKEFIAYYFYGNEIFLAEREKTGDYIVSLSNGIEIKFKWTGDWLYINGNNNKITHNVLPKKVIDTIIRLYPQSAILNTSVNDNRYDIQLDNNMNLYIEKNGKLIGRKYEY